MLSINIICMYLSTWIWIRYFSILFVVTNIHNQGLKQKKKNKDFILDLNKKTNFQKHKRNATKILYPLYGASCTLTVEPPNKGWGKGDGVRVKTRWDCTNFEYKYRKWLSPKDLVVVQIFCNRICKFQIFFS